MLHYGLVWWYMDNEYLGITEAAEYLRVSASTLRRWEKKGFLVPERTPTGIRRYTKQQLDDVIQSPDGFSQTHSVIDEATHKLAPHEELQASIEKQLEDIVDETYPKPIEPVQEEALLSNNSAGEVMDAEPVIPANVIHDYPPYGVEQLNPNNLQPAVIPLVKETEVVSVDNDFQDQIRKDFYTLGNKQVVEEEKHEIAEPVQSKLANERPVNQPRIEPQKVEVFHSEYEQDSEPIEDLEEYDTDAASANENGRYDKTKRSTKSPRVPVWILIAGAVLVIIIIVVVLLLTKNSASELISPLAE